MLPLIRREIVQKHGWVSDEQVVNYFAVSQATPGIIAMNTATLIGMQVAGFWGGLVAAVAVVLPSLIIILTIAMLFSSFTSVPMVAAALGGIRAGVCALILRTALGLIKQNVKNMFSICLFAAVLCAVLFTSLSPVVPIVAAATAGVLFAVKQGGAA